MKQSVIDKFNAATVVSDAAFEKAKNAGFPWQYFIERAQAKARDSGFLPDSGFLVYEARYVNSAERIVSDVFASIEVIRDAHTLVGWFAPWKDSDSQRWKEIICSISCALFDVGVVAALTMAPENEEDPIIKNGGLSIFGDVGFMGLREKEIALVHEIGGDSAVRLMGEVGDCACLHLYADQFNTDRVFKMNSSLREAYVRNACYAAYLAGTVFIRKLLESQN